MLPIAFTSHASDKSTLSWNCKAIADSSAPVSAKAQQVP